MCMDGWVCREACVGGCLGERVRVYGWGGKEACMGGCVGKPGGGSLRMCVCVSVQNNFARLSTIKVPKFPRLPPVSVCAPGFQPPVPTPLRSHLPSSPHSG